MTTIPQTWHGPPEIKPQYFSLSPSLWPGEWQKWPNSSLSWKIKWLFCLRRHIYSFGAKGRVAVSQRWWCWWHAFFNFMSRVTFSLATTLSTKKKYRTFRRNSELSVFIYFLELFSVLEEFPFLIRFWTLLVTVTLLAASIAFYVVFHME